MKIIKQKYRIENDKHENHQNLIISIQNQETHKNHRIPQENNGNHKK